MNSLSPIVIIADLFSLNFILHISPNSSHIVTSFCVSVRVVVINSMSSQYPRMHTGMFSMCAPSLLFRQFRMNNN